MSARSITRSLAAAAALVVLSSSAAQAQTNISQTFYLQPGVAGAQVAYLTFEVQSAGTFDMFTMAPSYDGQIHLFVGTPGAFGAHLGENDDSCPTSLCGPSTYANAFFRTFLSAGTYTLAGSDFAFYADEAISGENQLDVSGDFTLVLQSQDGLAISDVTATPEPGTVALLATGLMVIGGAGAARRRRQQQG